MTMQDVLDGIGVLDARFNRQDKRLQALERETGIDDSDYPDDDDDDEAKKKSEEAMADDDDPDKDRSKSTRTPGVQPMTRAQMHKGRQGKKQAGLAAANMEISE